MTMEKWFVRSAFSILGPIVVASCFALVSRDRTIGIAGADDAYFYLTVARNAAQGHLSSFDGASMTNGYHPLWAAILTPLFLLVTDKDVALFVTLITCCLLHGVTLRAIWRILARRVSVEAACFGAAFFVLFGLVPAWYLGQGPLAMAVFALFVELFLRVALDEPGSRSPWSTGLALGLFAAAAVLARLDTIMPTMASLAWLWLARRGAARFVATVALATMGVFVGLYVASNVMTYGHAVPISGVLKSSFPLLSLINYPLTSPKWYRLLVPLVVALAFTGWRVVARRARTRGSPTIDGPLGAITAGILVFFAYEMLCQKDADYGLYSWHFAVATCVASILAGRLFDACTHRPRLRRAAGPALLAVALVALVGRYGLTTKVDTTLADAHCVGRWIDENLPKGAVIAATDAGLVSYFGDRPTVNLDGLINNFEYQEVLRDKNIAAYLDAKRVTHLVIRDGGAARRTSGDYLLSLPSRLYPGAEDSVVVSMQSRLYAAPNRTAALFARVTGQRTSPR